MLVDYRDMKIEKIDQIYRKKFLMYSTISSTIFGFFSKKSFLLVRTTPHHLLFC